MRHHAQHVATFVENSCDVAGRAVGVGCLRDGAVGFCVAESYPPVRFQLIERLGVGEVVALAVGDGHADDLPRRRYGGEGAIGVLYAQVDPLATELQVAQVPLCLASEAWLERVWKEASNHIDYVRILQNQAVP